MQLRDSGLSVPAARTIDLVTTESKDEVLVYDQAVHHIHHLNATAANVWRLCDGERSVSDIAVETGLTEDAVKLALRTLEDAHLLDGPLTTSQRGMQSRRAFSRKLGIAAIPAIVSVTAPIAKAAASHGGAHCTPQACTNSSSNTACCTSDGYPGHCSSGQVCRPD